MTERIRQLLSVEVRGGHDVVLARQRARQIAGLLGFDNQDQTRLGTAVSEIVRNAYRYAGGGKVVFRLREDGTRRLVIAVSDGGAGIANLDDILAGRFTSHTGMGMGLIGTRRIMDEFEITTRPGFGTTVVMGKYLSPRAPALTDETMARLGAALATGVPGDPIGEVQQQNQELLTVLDELQQRQQELQVLNRELEDTNRGVVALYAELDARADFLRRASEIKSRFLSNMTHEFRTPLNSIIALSGMLQARTDGELTAEQEKQVGFIQRSANSLAELVNDLLDIARVDAGKVSVKPSDFTIASLFGALKGMLRPLLPAGIAVSLHFDEPENEPPALRTDEGKVSQILRNFISNALKFTERGEVRVSAEVSGNRVRFTVADTGVGIAAENLGRVFEEFGQVETGVQQRFRGTGLGLPLSKRLAVILGGTVGVTSTPGIGSVFTLDIPARFAGSDGELVQVMEPVRHQFKRQALVIDDDEVSRYLLKGLLPASFEVAEASFGGDGLEAVRRMRPDVVFLDLSMPGASGFDVLAAIRADDLVARTRVVVYSAHPLSDADVARLSAADAVLAVKGDDIGSARTVVTRALARLGLVMENPHG